MHRSPSSHTSNRSVTCLVVTVSDTRTVETDTSGALAEDLLRSAGHEIVGRMIVIDDRTKISGLVKEAIENPSVEAVLLTGGTGVGPRDVTVEAVASCLEKNLDGFGELFRSLSYAEIGSAAMLSRAIAGTAKNTVIFALPGSTKAVRLGIETLIAPQLGHLLDLLQP